MDLSLGNVINVSVAGSQLGAGKYNTSNQAVFTRETPNDSFGVNPFKIYLDNTGVETDWGTLSLTTRASSRIFGQSPNIRFGGGYLVVIPFLAGIDQVQHWTFTGVAASGSIVAKWGSASSAPILFGDNAAAIQAKIRALPGLGNAVVTGSITAGLVVVTLTGVGGNPALFTFASNTLMTVAPVAVTVVATIATAGTNETLSQAILRTQGLVQYFGIHAAEITVAAEGLTSAALVQTMRAMLFLGSRVAVDYQPAGYLDELRSGAFSQSRGLYYGGTSQGPSSDIDVVGYLAAYASLNMAVDFTGEATTKTAQMKTLEGMDADSTIDQTQLNAAKTAGVDVYASIGGVAKLLTSKENVFFDRVFNQLAFAGDLAISQFNVLAETETKIAQTDDDVKLMTGASRLICKQYVRNRYLAPGVWTDSATFGIPADFFRNIAEQGYFIFVQPVGQQDPADREARHAPLQQVAVKEAGAIHDGNLLININP